MTLVHVDGRKRVSLGKWLRPNQTYRATVDEYGKITLEPVTVMTEAEIQKIAEGGTL